MKKKLTAMLLALCMLLAAVPALGDDDISGTWYYVMADVTVGCFELSEDGTVSMSMDGRVIGEGTWMKNGTAITILMDGDLVIFTYDGTTLAGENYPMTLYREAGKVDYDVIQKMYDPEFVLPAGMTSEELAEIAGAFEEEVKKLQQSIEEKNAERRNTDVEEAEIKYLNENFFVMKRDDHYCAVYNAKIMNSNNYPVVISDETMQVLNAQGEQVGESKYDIARGSTYLEPGEVSFISMRADIPENVEVTYTKDCKVRKSKIYVRDISIPTSESGFTLGGTYAFQNTVWTTITNNTENPVPDIEVVFALEDENGTVWYVENESLYSKALYPASSIMMKGYVDEAVQDYCKENKIELTTLETSAWARVDD